MGGFGRVAVAVTVMTVMVALAGGCGESKKDREAREAQEAVAAAQAREQMAREQERMAQEQAERAQKAAAEQAVEQARTGWYNANPNASTFNISTAEQLVGLAQLVNGGNSFVGKTIKLMNDIDLSEYGKGSAFNGGKGWIPIHGFYGTFDGGGKKIRGLYINDNVRDNAGLFAGLGTDTDSDGLTAVIKNVGLVDVDITGGNFVGGVAGSINDHNVTVVGCYSTGAVRGKNSVGGLVGYFFCGNVTNSYSSATVKGTDDVGGLFGEIPSNSICGFGSASNSYSTGTVSGNSRVGGVAGRNEGKLSGCYSTGTVSGNVAVGGVAGTVMEGNMSNCYSTGAVSGNEDVGGVAGLVSAGGVSNSYSTGTVNGNSNVGGIAGRTNLGAKCDPSLTSCDVDVPDGTVTNSAALNPTVKGKSNVGRIVGKNGGSVSNNIAFAGLKDGGSRTDRWTVKGEDTSDGEDVTAEEIATDGTLGARFHGKPWITENGKLPVLRGKPVNIPSHLRQ